ATAIADHGRSRASRGWRADRAEWRPDPRRTARTRASAGPAGLLVGRLDGAADRALIGRPVDALLGYDGGHEAGRRAGEGRAGHPRAGRGGRTAEEREAPHLVGGALLDGDLRG